MHGRAIATFLLAFALNGCSSTYDIRAVVLNGKLAFVPTTTDIWGKPDCIYFISVSAVNGPPAMPTKGGSASMVGLITTLTYEVSATLSVIQGLTVPWVETYGAGPFPDGPCCYHFSVATSQ